jgi:cytochrome c-type biogenesis protein CcmH
MSAAVLMLWLWQASVSEAEIRDQAREIESELIAPCCWSQPVSQHYSREAAEIRREVHDMLAGGRTRDEILEIYVAKYGERVLARPRARGFNVLVYLMPWLALGVGIYVLARVLKGSRKGADGTPPPSLVPQRYAMDVERELKNME